MRRLWIVAALLVFSPAAYSSDQLRIVSMGLTGYYDLANPTSVRVVIDHSSTLPDDVQIRVLVSGPGNVGDQRPDSFTTQVHLAPQEQRTFDFPVLIQYFPGAVVRVLELDSQGHGIAEDVQELDFARSTDHLIALLCAQPAVCQQIKSEIQSSGNEQSRSYKEKMVAFATIEDPPANFWDYSTAQTLILARPLASMSAAQQTAIEGYVREGGSLIVVQDLAPAAGFLSSYRPATSAITAVSAGRGRIVWLASAAGGQLGDLYGGTPGSGPLEGWTPRGRLSHDILSWVRNRFSTRFQLPTLTWLLVWLMAYVLIAGIGNSLVLWRLGRREWAWITLPAISIVFSFAMYLSVAAHRPEELHADDVAVYWMDEASPVALVERGERISSNRHLDLSVVTQGDEILLGDRNDTRSFVTLDTLLNQTGQVHLNRWEVKLGPSPAVDLGLLQWSFRELEFAGMENQPGTVRRVDNTHLRNDTGRDFTQGMFIDPQYAYFYGAIPSDSVIDLGAPYAKKPFDQATQCLICSNRYPAELAGFGFRQSGSEGPIGAVAGNGSPAEVSDLSHKPFNLAELIRAWPADGGRAFQARSGIFFGLARENQPHVTLLGQKFTASGYSLTIVSFEPKP